MKKNEMLSAIAFIIVGIILICLPACIDSISNSVCKTCGDKKTFTCYQTVYKETDNDYKAVAAFFKQIKNKSARDDRIYLCSKDYKKAVEALKKVNEKYGTKIKLEKHLLGKKPHYNGIFYWARALTGIILIFVGLCGVFTIRPKTKETAAQSA